MSHWIHTKSVVAIADSNKRGKNFGVGGGVIELSKWTKIRRKIKNVEGTPQFIAACNKVGIPPTRRQFGKFKRSKGLAWNAA